MISWGLCHNYNFNNFYYNYPVSEGMFCNCTSDVSQWWVQFLYFLKVFLPKGKIKIRNQILSWDPLIQKVQNYNIISMARLTITYQYNNVSMPEGRLEFAFSRTREASLSHLWHTLIHFTPTESIVLRQKLFQVLIRFNVLKSFPNWPIFQIYIKSAFLKIITFFNN